MSLDHVLEWGKKLKPPSGASQGKDVTAWRWTVAITLGVTTVGLAAHIAIACGYVAFMHPGFARADEISKVQSQIQQVANSIDSQRISTLKSSILETRQKQCKATAEVRPLYTESLQSLLVEYEEMTKRRYPLPGCENF